MDLNKYIPILRTKNVEYQALKKLDDKMRGRITPLYELRKQPKQREDQPFVDLKTYIKKAANGCAESWFEGVPIAFDTQGLGDELKIDGNKGAVVYFYEMLVSNGMKVIPTITTDRSLDFCKSIKVFSTDFIIRVFADDLNLPQATKDTIVKQVKALSCTFENCHLLVDLKYFDDYNLDDMIDRISNFTSILNIEDWASMTFAGCSFPEDMSGIKRDSEVMIPRREYECWKLLNECSALIGTKMRFADYTVVNPLKPELGGIYLKSEYISNKIRYTLPEQWLVCRGASPEDREEKYEVYQQLAHKVVSNAGFKGSEFSWADKCILDCATNNEKICGLQKWLQIDINHHVALVSEQVQSAFDQTGN